MTPDTAKDGRLANNVTRANDVRARAAKVKELRAGGLTLKALAKRFGVSTTIINQVLEEDPWSVRNFQ